MQLALQLAMRGQGITADAPSVGCVIVKDGRLLGRGHGHPPTGRPHAEVMALQQAGSNAHGATAYTTLEPCAHHGKTPPCTQALIQAGVTRVVSATQDPDSRVSGRGFAQLHAAGIAVTVGVLQAEAQAHHAGFFSRILHQRPQVSAKIASSLDGRIALSDGTSQWITNPTARHFGHYLRTTHDAILIGSGTLLRDNPSLTCRLPGLEARSPIRLLLTRQPTCLQPQHVLWQTAAQHPTWILCDQPYPPDYQQQAQAAGIILLQVTNTRHLPDVLSLLAQHGINHLLLESGSRLTSACLDAGLIDHLYWLQAPLLLGADSQPAIAARHLSHLPQGEWHLCRRLPMGDNTLLHLQRDAHNGINTPHPSSL